MRYLWLAVLAMLSWMLWLDYRAAFWTFWTAGLIEHVMHWGPMHHEIPLLKRFYKPHADHHVAISKIMKASAKGQVADVSQYKQRSGILLFIPIVWLLAGVLASFNRGATGAQIAVTGTLYVLSYETVHAGIHLTESPHTEYWFEQFWLFDFLSFWHKEHHRRKTIHFGVLLGIVFDFLFGTRARRRARKMA